MGPTLIFVLLIWHIYYPLMIWASLQLCDGQKVFHQCLDQNQEEEKSVVFGNMMLMLWWLDTKLIPHLWRDLSCRFCDNMYQVFGQIQNRCKVQIVCITCYDEVQTLFVQSKLYASAMWSWNSIFVWEFGLQHTLAQAIFWNLLVVVAFFGVRRHHTTSIPHLKLMNVFVRFCTKNLFLLAIIAGLPLLPFLWNTFNTISKLSRVMISCVYRYSIPSHQFGLISVFVPCLTGAPQLSDNVLVEFLW